jgi:hypothetical protein
LRVAEVVGAAAGAARDAPAGRRGRGAGLLGGVAQQQADAAARLGSELEAAHGRRIRAFGDEKAPETAGQRSASSMAQSASFPLPGRAMMRREGGRP